MVLSELVEFGPPCFPAETVKGCAVIGAHMMAEENALRSDRDSSLDQGEMWEHCCYEHNVDSLAIEVVVPWRIGRSGGWH